MEVPPERSAPAAAPEFAYPDGVAAPRKQPLQERARATVAAILQATLQVLDEAGVDRLTTTRVADIAGVSVGTLYQYFPNRDALLNAVLADHLEHAIGAVERAAAAAASAGLPRREAVEMIARAFLAAKATRVVAARIMNKAFGAGLLDERPLVAAIVRRAHVAVAPIVGDLETAQLACAALEGMVRAAVDADPARLADPAWVDQVVRIATAALAP